MRSFLIAALLFVSVQIFGIEAGGKFDLLSSASINYDKSISKDILESADIELFLPKLLGHDLKFECIIYKPLQSISPSENISVFMKKLYLGLRFKYVNLTIGRQPVSWAFGSFFNPIDYSLGSIALNEENNSKYTDAVEMYIPINWNSSISAVASFPNGLTDDTDSLKWGARARFGILGYDLTLNYVKEAYESSNSIISAVSINSILPKKRFGAALKGDIKDMGVYASIGYYFDSIYDGAVSYLIGGDYSFNFSYNKKIILQAEYMGIEVDFLDTLIRTEILKLNRNDERFDMFTGSINYPIDDFSSITLFSIVDLNDKSFILSPVYQNVLPLNIDVRLSVFAFFGGENTLLAPSTLIPYASGSIDLGYKF